MIWAKETLGKLAYDHAKDANMVNFTGNTEFYSHVEKIDSIQDAIAKKENDIDFIKSQYNIPEEDVQRDVTIVMPSLDIFGDTNK